MPNCDFYALREDLEAVLEFVFERSGCRVFESYSPFDQALAEFRSIADIDARYPIGACRGNTSSVLLQLFPESAGPIGIERIALDPDKCDGATFRYCASGWGMIQLYLGGVNGDAIVSSHTNHQSEKRARVWEATSHDVMGPVSAWHWPLVENTSRRINAHIRKLASQKIGSRAVLPAAAAALERGARVVG